jgi:hypothetical protein
MLWFSGIAEDRFLVENPLYGSHVRLSAEAGIYYIGYLV